MTRVLLAMVMIWAGLSGGAAALLAQQPPQENEPGRPTQARVFVLNRDAAEAVPVLIQRAAESLPVVVAGMPAVSLAPNASVQVLAARQTWEYRQVTPTAGQDLATALNTAGVDGWEAVGVIGTGSAASVIMKRPR